LGQVYNIGSGDEISNLELCGKILTALNIPHSTPADFRRWVKYTHDRPFNDCRYAVDDTKLRDLGWVQRTSFDDGLKRTVDWYARFGEIWWGDISHVLTPFPMVSEGEVVPDEGHAMKDDPPLPGEECLAEGETLTRIASGNRPNAAVDTSAQDGERLPG
jgi:dTDP-glucose 4,6-dehydratase